MDGGHPSDPMLLEVLLFILESSILDHFTNNWDKTIFATATIAQQAQLAKDETAIRWAFL